MSKLDGNERWKGKMLLTEHQEQYDSRKNQRSSKPSEEELKMVRDSIILPHMLTMVEHDMQITKQSIGFLNRLKLAVVFMLHDLIGNDLRQIKRELAKRNIKVFADEEVDLIIYHRIFCRGYEERFGMVRETMKSEIRVKMTEYIKTIEALLRNSKMSTDAKNLNNTGAGR